MVKKTISIKMKGKLKDINSFCEAMGELSNEYNVEIEV